MDDDKPLEVRVSSSFVHVPRWLAAGGTWGWRLVAMGVALYGIGYVLSYLRTAVLPVLLGILLATLLVPIAKLLRKLKFPRALAGAVAVLLGLSVIGGIVTAMGFAIAGEWDQLGQSLEQGYREAVEWVAQFAGIPKSEVMDWINGHLQELKSSAGSYAKEAFSQLKNLLSGVAVTLLALVFAWFFASDGDQQFEKCLAAVPPKQRSHIQEMAQRVWTAVGAYMRGMLVIAAADALLLGLGLLIIGMPLILPLMLVMFLGALVPFVGPFVAGATAALIGLANGGLTQAGLAVLVALLVQQIEGNFLQPFIMGRAVKLHPAVVLFAITAGAVLAGIAGIFFAVPVAATIYELLSYGREQEAI